MKDFRIIALEAGGPAVMAFEPVVAARPGPGQVRVRQTAVGVNFVDTYHRSGLYPGKTPRPLGGEAAGFIEDLHPTVQGFSVGDRVAYGTGGQGAYATVRVMPAEHLIRLPNWISDETAAAIMLKGMTAAYLIGPCAKIAPGHIVLVHAAAGGVGSLLVPWLASLGARVIAHAGTAEKVERAKRQGAEWAFSCQMDQLAREVRDVTGGHGADVVFDGIGAASWDATLELVAPRGLIVSYGNASGPVPPTSPLDLMRCGSVFLTRPTLRDYAATRSDRQALVASLFARIGAGDVPVHIGRRDLLVNCVEAHRALEARETTGAIVLWVDQQ